jgi:hypothetical protein
MCRMSVISWLLALSMCSFTDGVWAGDPGPQQVVSGIPFKTLQSTADVSPDRITNFCCVIRNDREKEIGAYVVIWRTKYASGFTHPGSVSVLDSFLSTKKIRSGETFEATSTTAIGAKPDNPAVKIEGIMDYVLFTYNTQ